MGNVLATVSDKKIGVDDGDWEPLCLLTYPAVPCYLVEISTSNDGIVDYFVADVVTATDYYSGDMQMVGRTFKQDGAYRYGFNGKENDNDVKDIEGSQQDYGMRMYDPRLSRFFNVDPITSEYPELTPFQFASNTPIQAVDLDGLEARYNDGGCHNNPIAHSRGLTNHTCYPIPWQGWKRELGTQLALAAFIVAPMLAPELLAFGRIMTLRIATSPAVIATVSSAGPVIAKYGPDAGNFVYGLISGDNLEPFPTNTGSQSADAGSALRGIFRSPVNITGLFKSVKLESFKFIKGVKGGKVAVIGQGMEKVKQVASALKDPEVFVPTADAQKVWDDLLKSAKGAPIPDEVVKGLEIYKQNVEWINRVKKEGYDILDTGGEATSTFYNMEKKAVYDTGN